VLVNELFKENVGRLTPPPPKFLDVGQTKKEKEK